MKQIGDVHAFQTWRKHRRERGLVGFVPTMGALHPGHRALIERARRECDCVVVSIFVNPTQFNDPEDCAKYPQPLERDLAICEETGADVVFTPTRDSLYPDDYRYRLTETAASLAFEGACRPGHFDGVLTIVMKLFQLVRADRAYFGEKDWQQLQLVRDMAQAFFLDTQVVACPTVREPDGLAMSSRNVRLSAEARGRAAAFPRILCAHQEADEARGALVDAGFQVEYVADTDGRRVAAVVIEGVRLIDNFALPVQPLNRGEGARDE